MTFGIYPKVVLIGKHAKSQHISPPFMAFICSGQTGYDIPRSDSEGADKSSVFQVTSSFKGLNEHACPCSRVTPDATCAAYGLNPRMARVQEHGEGSGERQCRCTLHTRCPHRSSTSATNLSRPCPHRKTPLPAEPRATSVRGVGFARVLGGGDLLGDSRGEICDSLERASAPPGCEA